jgi:hypothetical protein
MRSEFLSRLRRLEQWLPWRLPHLPRLRVPDYDGALMTEAEAREQGRLWIPEQDDRYAEEEEG